MTKFTDIGLKAEIQQSLEKLGYEMATPIQAKAIPFILESKQDLIALAQTGTGKTAAFGLPIVNQLEPGAGLQAIIMCPTRELCLQTTKEIKAFSSNIKGIKILAVYGGERIDLQISGLRAGVDVVVGTPGRVHDLIRRNVLKLQDIQWLVLDEADEMLDMGFKEDLDAVLEKVPETRQTLLFSATMSSSIHNIAKNYMRKPKEISVVSKNSSTAENIVHQYYVVHAKDRYEALRRIVDSIPDVYGICFCRTRRETQEIADALKEDRYSAEALHGEVSQGMRTAIMDRFRKGQIQLLVATDVAARGIDISDLTHVINYTLPDSVDVYVHRSGRTGRASKSGVSISILHLKETRKVKDLERRTGKTFVKKEIPSGKEICERQLFNLVEKLKNTEVNQDKIEQYLPSIDKLLADLSREDLIARFVSTEFNHFLNAYKDAPDLNVRANDRDFGRDRRDGGRDRGRGRDRDDSDVSFVNIRINLGKKDHLDIKTLFSLINDQPALRGAEIGKIVLEDTHSVFAIDKRFKDAVGDSFRKTKYRGRNVEARLNGGSEYSRRSSDGDDGGERRRPSGGRSGARRSGRSEGSSRRSSRDGGGYRGKGRR